VTPELSTYRVVAVPNPFREERVIFDCPSSKSIAGAIEEIEARKYPSTSYTRSQTKGFAGKWQNKYHHNSPESYDRNTNAHMLLLRPDSPTDSYCC